SCCSASMASSEPQEERDARIVTPVSCAQTLPSTRESPCCRVMVDAGGVGEPGGDGRADGCCLGARNVGDSEDCADASGTLRRAASNVSAGLGELSFQDLARSLTTRADAWPALLRLKDKVLGSQHEVEIAAALVARALIGLFVGVILQCVASSPPDCPS